MGSSEKFAEIGVQSQVLLLHSFGVRSHFREGGLEPVTSGDNAALDQDTTAVCFAGHELQKNRKRPTRVIASSNRAIILNT